MNPSLEGKVRRLAIPLVVASLVIAGGLGAYVLIYDHPRDSSQSIVRLDGPTLYQALAAVNSSVENATGGPWDLFSVYGIAAQVPFSANVIGYPENNRTINNCGEEFDGLTLWNGTMPLFNGTFNSGTAPFWQFAFYSNTSDSILLATDTMGILHVFPPQSYPGPCNAWYDLGSNPSYWFIPTGLFPSDSPAAAQSAISSPVGNWVQMSEPEVEIITIGPGVFTGYGDVSGYGVIFDRCGLLGVAGPAEPLVQIGENLQGQIEETFNLTHNCAVPNSGYSEIDGDYDVLFDAANLSSAGDTQLAQSAIQLNLAYPNGTPTNDYDAWGLANWMTHINLTTSGGSALPLAPASCQGWVPSPDSCEANSSGWFAIVLSESGGWLNSYGLLPNGTAGWSEPVTALASNQQLVIVSPASWTLGGDRVDMNSTVSTSTVIGSLTL